MPWHVCFRCSVCSKGTFSSCPLLSLSILFNLMTISHEPGSLPSRSARRSEFWVSHEFAGSNRISQATGSGGTGSGGQDELLGSPGIPPVAPGLTVLLLLQQGTRVKPMWLWDFPPCMCLLKLNVNQSKSQGPGISFCPLLILPCMVGSLSQLKRVLKTPFI